MNNTSATGNVTAIATSSLFGAGTNGFVLAQVNGVPTWTATTTLSTISGQLALGSQVSGTLGVVNGGTGVTTLTQNQFAFYNGTGFTTASTTAINNSLGTLGIGTSTPRFLLQLASSTAPQLTLSDASLTAAAYNFRAINNLLYIGTSSPSTFATTSSSIFALDSSTGSTTVQKLDVTGNATSTHANGINLTSGCFSINNTCVGAGSFSNTLANGGTATTTFYAGGVVYSDGTKLTQASTSNGFMWSSQTGSLGLGTSTPQWALTIASSTRPQLTLSDGSLTSAPWNLRSINGNFYLSTSSPTTFATSTYAALAIESSGNIATTSINTGFNVGSGALTYDYYSGLTSIANANIGAMTFDTDSGVISWVDMPVTSSASAGTAESYSAQIDGTSILTVFAVSDGAGGIASTSVGVGSTTPWGMLSVNPTASLGTAPQFVIGSTTGGTSFIVKNSSDVGVGTSSPYAQLSIGSHANQDSFAIGSSTGTWLKVTSLGTTSIAKLDVTGTATSSFTGNGINLTSGCFAINNVCVGGSSGGIGDPFLHQSTFGATASATTTPLWAQAGLYASSTVAFGTAGKDLLFNSSTGFLGIGSTSPFGQLSINPTTTNGTAPSFVIGSSTATNFIVTNAGNVGIGTAAPGYKLEVSGSASIPALIRSTGTTASLLSFADANTSVAPAIGSTDEDLVFWSGGAARALLSATTGGLGIGTTTPQWQLTLASSTRPQLTLTDGSSTAAPFNFRAINNTLYISTSSASTFATTSSSILAFDSSTGSTTVQRLSVTAAATSSFAGGVNIETGGVTVRTLTSCDTIDTDVNGNLICGADAGGAGGTPSGTGTELQYKNGSSFGAVTNSAFDTSYGALGLGTTSPKWTLTLASSTAPQLALTDGSLTSNGWVFRNAGGNFYLGTSSASTFATTSIAAMTILSNGNVGFGTTSPYADFALVGNGDERQNPLFVIATTSSWGPGQQPLLFVDATTTGKLNYERIAIGTTSPWGLSGLRDSFTVDGRIYSTWRELSCDFPGAGFVSAPTADTVGACGGFSFDFDTDGTGVITNHMYPPSFQLRAGSTNATVGDGSAFRTSYVLGSATTSPVIEAWVRPSMGATSTSTPIFLVGLTNEAFGADTGALPTQGAYFIATSSATWKAVTRSANNVETMSDTGVATSSTDFKKMRIELTDQEAIFLVNGTVNVRHTTNIPTANLAPIARVGVFANGGTNVGTPSLYVAVLRYWMDDPPGGIEGQLLGEAFMEEFNPIQGADIAEAYLSDIPSLYIPGLLVANATSSPNAIRLAHGAYDNDIFGAITTSPHTVLGQEASTTVRVGLVGRVPIIVSLSNGSIKQGDRITSATSTAGIGMKATRPGRIVGVALEGFDPENSSGSCDANLTDELLAAGVNVPTGTCLARIMVKLEPNFDMSIGNLVQDLVAGALGINDAIEELANAAFSQGAELTKYVVGQLVAKIAVVETFFTKSLTILPDGIINAPGGSNQVTGLATLSQGTTSIFVPNAKVTSSSKIFLTPRALLASPLAVTEIQPGSGFTVSVVTSTSTDVPFDFLIINSYGGASAPNTSQGSQPPPAATPPPAEGGGSGSGGTGSTTPSGDTTPPSVSLNGDPAISVTQGSSFTDPSATAADDTDGDLTGSISVEGSVDANTVGTYTLTYSATDAAGNTGSASRVVTVVAPEPAAEPPPTEPPPTP
ncbi:MAG: hypothetical protein ABA06_00015 [Parcubacteria bacterium C7867-001]|nr:MAG: hypothetical protein ABA06_00015 [Parcubacteria bacterium C7867-001]